MPTTIERSIHVSAPLGDVFAYMDEPAHQAAISPRLTRSEEIERLPNGGVRARWTYRLLGLVPLTGTVRATAYEPPSEGPGDEARIDFVMEGGLDGAIWWRFRRERAPSGAEGTRVTYGTRYAVNVPALGPALERLAAPTTETQVVRSLQNLRARFEG
jgi:hypothetical protein